MVVVLFYTSLFLVTTMLAIKFFGFSIVNNKISARIKYKSDKYCHNAILLIKYFLSKIKIKNFHKLFLVIVNFTKMETISLKRKFDSKQPKFFLKPQKSGSNSKSAVSFFLKNVSEYKNSLRDKDSLKK